MLKLSAGTAFKPVLKAAEKAFKKLQSKGSYTTDDLLRVKEYTALAEKTAAVFNGAVQDNDIPPAMMQALKDDVFLFSALKTHAQLLEASRLLLNDDGRVKQFSQFSRDIAKLKTDYNRDYLEAEYQFAITSAQMAGKWAASSDRYDLQYRTAGDDRVRQSHAQLNNITLPKDDPFWLSYYPPNGWRCRCNALEVLKGKYEVSDSADAISKGETATSQIGKDGKNRLEIFRFNPGAQKVVFPPTHPYNKVQGAAKVKANIPLGRVEDLETLPESFKQYAKTNKIDLDSAYGMFSKLKKQVGFEEFGSQSFYREYGHKVVIGKNQQGLKMTIVHEFGHALDAENKFYENKKTFAVMGKYYAKYGAAGFAELDNKLKAINGHDATCVRDTIMAISLKFGAGHTEKYFKEKKGINRPKEFLAHCFENRFVGNEVFERYAPELYNDMKALADDLISEIE